MINPLAIRQRATFNCSARNKSHKHYKVTSFKYSWIHQPANLDIDYLWPAPSQLQRVNTLHYSHIHPKSVKCSCPEILSMFSSQFQKKNSFVEVRCNQKQFSGAVTQRHSLWPSQEPQAKWLLCFDGLWGTFANSQCSTSSQQQGKGCDSLKYKDKRNGLWHLEDGSSFQKQVPTIHIPARSPKNSVWFQSEGYVKDLNTGKKNFEHRPSLDRGERWNPPQETRPRSRDGQDLPHISSSKQSQLIILNVWLQ